MTEACHDIAHLGHVEILTDRFDDSLDFFTRIYGLKLASQYGDDADLRAWGVETIDNFHTHGTPPVPKEG